MKDAKYLHEEIKRRDDDYQSGWSDAMDVADWVCIGIMFGLFVWMVS